MGHFRFGVALTNIGPLGTPKPNLGRLGWISRKLWTTSGFEGPWRKWPSYGLLPGFKEPWRKWVLWVPQSKFGLHWLNINEVMGQFRFQGALEKMGPLGTPKKSGPYRPLPVLRVPDKNWIFGHPQTLYGTSTSTAIISEQFQAYVHELFKRFQGFQGTLINRLTLCTNLTVSLAFH